MAGVVIGCFGADFSSWWDQSQFVEKFADIFDLVGQRLAGGLLCVLPMVSVIFQHGATPGHIDQNCVDVGVLWVGKRGQILIGKVLGGFCLTGMKMNRTTTALGRGDNDFTAVFLEYTDGRHMRRAKNGISYAAGEQGDAGAAVTLGRVAVLQRRQGSVQRWQHGQQPAEARGE